MKSRQSGRLALTQGTDWFEERAARLLEPADVQLDGNRPWDIRINHPGFIRRVMLQGTLGLGEAYMDGWWDCDQLDELFYRLAKANVDRAVHDWRALLLQGISRIINLQTRRRARRVGERHYDLGNELFERMLDPRMLYSCGYWREARTLAEAQEAKLELIAKKLQLEPGMKVLDIGCGWGGAAAFLAERYGVEVTGVTISREQWEYAKGRWLDLPVKFLLQDYRDVTGTFDRAYSIGMFEHVGVRNYAEYMRVVRGLLKPDGLFLLHTIGRNESARHTNPWIAKYIFPNSMLPSIRQIGEAMEGRFVMEDWQNFGADYDRTLLAWHANFEAASDLPPQYDERFRRMWRLYLMMSAGGFRARRMQLWQLVLSPEGIGGVYHAPR